ncbi:MAG: hypothetical protein EXS08_02960 [Planctomycetes bacterium]|nr:hypothetical protein [Planctomycetota bacterium]
MDERAREDWLARLAQDWRTAELSAVDAALCAYAQKLTLAPALMQRADLAPLRELGLDDAAIHDAIQVIGYFNYINRVADAVHVDLEPGMPPYPGSHGET